MAVLRVLQAALDKSVTKMTNDWLLAEDCSMGNVALFLNVMENYFKLYILSSFTHLHVVPNQHCYFGRSWNRK